MHQIDDFKRPILKQSQHGQVRIFRPYEIERILNYGCLKLEHKTMFRSLLYTGMRYVEMQRFQKHPNWYSPSDGFIHLPSWIIYKNKVELGASRKAKRKQSDRWVRLNNQGKQVIEYFVSLDKKMPDYNGWNANLKCWCRRAEIDPVGVSVKSTRKTWESWLLFIYPTRILDIVNSQGHTATVSIQHYCNMPFTDEDKVGIKRYVEGWIN